MELSLKALFYVLVKKGFLWFLSYPPTTKFDIFFHNTGYDFAHDITNIEDMPAIFVFCALFCVFNKMQINAIWY